MAGPKSERDHRPEKLKTAERCLLCKSKLLPSVIGLHDTRFGIAESYDIYRCGSCSLEQTLPRPSLAELKRLYETHYNFGGQVGRVYSHFRDRFLSSALYRIWMRIDGDVSFHLRKGSGSLLDIGCNEGRGLRLYQRNGFQAEGLEVNETAAAEARSAGFVVHTCSLKEIRSEKAYQVAVLSNVLEHSVEPGEMLRDVRRILASGGEVWISCPNAKSWFRRIFGKSWINWHVPFHISHFSTPTLTCLLREAGFIRIEVQQITPSVWIAQSLIVYLFGGSGKNLKLRNPFLTIMLMALVKGLLFPVTWLANRMGRGDCLVAVASKP